MREFYLISLKRQNEFNFILRKFFNIIKKSPKLYYIIYEENQIC